MTTEAQAKARRIIQDLADTYEMLLSWLGERSPVQVENVNGSTVLVINTRECESIGRNVETPNLSAVYQSAHADMHMAASVTSWLAAGGDEEEARMIQELAVHRDRVLAAAEQARDAALKDHARN
ncbi:hypothetical protein [Nonomuraea sp. LPB2021202275-12-8]|uniref:hypothetical protein n=1 Tax=Nonomuraea sp. LPB2021202275-12-8 TaxID=3120159 RepID=UPI00300D18D6